MQQLYLIPVEQIGMSRGPMYLAWRLNPNGLQCRWNLLDYGSINLALVAVDTDQTGHDWLSAQDNVYPIPISIDVNVPQASVSTLQSYLESNGVPGDWTSPALTWRQTLRTISGMFLYMQRLTGITGNVSPLDWGYTLNTQWQNVSTMHQDAIVGAAASLGYDTSFIRNTTLLRAIIKAFADAWGTAPIHFGFLTL